MIAPLITLLNVTKLYSQGNVPVVALRDVSVTIEAGECVAIMGSSGSGKSTLLNLIGCIDVPTHGSVSIDGQLTTHLADAELTVLRRDKVGMIFQFFNLLGTLTARQNVALPMLLAGLPPKTGLATGRRVTGPGRSQGAHAASTLSALRRRDAAGGHRSGVGQQSCRAAGG